MRRVADQASISLRFRAALKAQRLWHLLPVKGKLQPYSAYYLLVWAPIVLFFSGYYLFYPGAFDGPGLVFAYGSFFIFAAILVGNKAYRMVSKNVTRRLGWIPAEQVDLTTGLDAIEAMTLAAEEKRASRPRSKLQRVNDFLF